MRQELIDRLQEHFEPFEIIKWLDQPHVEFNGRSPSEVIIDQGYEVVLKMLEGLDRT